MAAMMQVYIIIPEHIWYKIKLTLRPPCFAVEIFLVPGVLAATFEAPIIMKIHISKIELWSVIFWSEKNLRMIF